MGKAATDTVPVSYWEYQHRNRVKDTKTPVSDIVYGPWYNLKSRTGAANTYEDLWDVMYLDFLSNKVQYQYWNLRKKYNMV